MPDLLIRQVLFFVLRVLLSTFGRVPIFLWIHIFLLMLDEYCYLCTSTCYCVCRCLYILWVIVVLCSNGCNFVGDVVIVLYGLIFCNSVGEYLHMCVCLF